MLSFVRLLYIMYVHVHWGIIVSRGGCNHNLLFSSEQVQSIRYLISYPFFALFPGRFWQIIWSTRFPLHLQRVSLDFMVLPVSEVECEETLITRLYTWSLSPWKVRIREERLFEISPDCTTAANPLWYRLHATLSARTRVLALSKYEVSKVYIICSPSPSLYSRGWTRAGPCGGHDGRLWWSQ